MWTLSKLARSGTKASVALLATGFPPIFFSFFSRLSQKTSLPEHTTNTNTNSHRR